MQPIHTTLELEVMNILTNDAAPAGRILANLLGNDNLRMAVLAELREVQDQLKRYFADNDFRIKCISDWHASFLKVLLDPTKPFPNLRDVIREFVQELVNILRKPGEPDAPFPAELFSDKALPLIQFVVAKMRNTDSLFYSKQFDEEAFRILEKEAPNEGIPLELLEQLRQIEEMNAKNLEEEAKSMVNLNALLGRLENRTTTFHAKLDQGQQHIMKEFQQIRANTKQLQKQDLDQRPMMREAAANLLQEAIYLRGEAQNMQRQIVLAGTQIDEIRRGNMNLQIELNYLRADIAEKKSRWLEDAFCVVASIALSWIFQTPVVIPQIS